MKNIRDLALSRALTTAVIGVSVLLAAWGLGRSGWSQEGGALAVDPARVDLLAEPPFDRITLTDGTVLDIEPVSPRPLPEPEKDERTFPVRRDRRSKAAEGLVPIGEAGRKTAVPEPKSETEEENEEINIHLIRGELGLRDYKVKRSDIRSIEYHEDLLLAAAERLIRARDYTRAFEHILVVQSRDPNWPGVQERSDQLLYEEGAQALREGDYDRGFRLLRELLARRPDYPGLADRLATAYGAQIAQAFEAGAYLRGRRLLHDLEGIAPDHNEVATARERFVTAATRQVERSKGLDPAGRLDALAEALRIWPRLSEAEASFPEAFRALPTLDVGVLDVASPVSPWVRSPADRRVAPLLYRPVLARLDEAAIRGERPDQLAAGLEVSELGRRLDLRLRTDVFWSDGSRPVSAVDVVRTLSDRADPRAPGFVARWAGLLERVEAVDEDRVEIRLARPFLQPEVWLLGPAAPAHAGADGWLTTLDQGRRPIGNGPFVWHHASDDRTEFLAAPTSGEGGDAGPSILRLRERRLPGAQAAVNALLRGDITLLERVPPDRVPALAAQDGLRLGRYQQPSLHQIALDGRNPALRNRSLRRALSYAIDRATLLDEVVLKQPPDDENTASDGPFPKGSYADAPDVKPLEYDPLLARALVAAARRELGGDPIKLRFEYPARPEAQAAVPPIAEALRFAGLEIETVERPESELEMALRSGRRFDLAYRVVQCEEPAWEAGPVISPAYDAPPSRDGLAAVASPRILQLLLDLEYASEWPTARGIVLQIDREVRDELPIIPLWQIYDHYAWRSRLHGPGETTARLYDAIATWEIEPWFAKDPW